MTVMHSPSLPDAVAGLTRSRLGRQEKRKKGKRVPTEKRRALVQSSRRASPQDLAQRLFACRSGQCRWPHSLDSSVYRHRHHRISLER